SFPVDRPVILSTGVSTTTAVATNAQIFPGPFYTNPGGRIALFTNAARIDIPTSSPRLTPYFTAGGGVASVRRTADFTYPVRVSTGQNIFVFRPTTERIALSSTDLALTLGGGVGVQIAGPLFLDVDLRLFRLLG